LAKDPPPDKTEGVQAPRIYRRKPPADPSPFLGHGFGEHTFKIESRETRVEVVARLNSEKSKLDHDLRKDLELFRVVMAIVGVATAACLFIVLSNLYSPAIQNAAMALIAAIVSGGVGYATGKSAK
jgi:hypothetical protein